MSPTREHRRQRSRSLSSVRRYEEYKQLVFEQERRQHAERRAQEAQRAAQDAARRRQRAEIEAENIRQQRDREIRRNSGLERERQRAAEDRRRLESEERRRRAAEDQHRIESDRRRRARAQQAGLPRRPRHSVVVHHDNDESFEERGNRVLREDIRAEDRRRNQGQQPLAGWLHRRADGLRRRNSIAATERRVYDDDRRRDGRRWF